MGDPNHFKGHNDMKKVETFRNWSDYFWSLPHLPHTIQHAMQLDEIAFIEQ